MIYIEYPLLKPAARNDSAARTMQVLNFRVKERNLLMLKLLFFFLRNWVCLKADTNEFQLYRCDYCGQHLENIRSAPTSSVLYPSYWIFPSVNIVEVPLQHRHSWMKTCQTFFFGVVSKLLGFLMMPSLCGLLLFEHWEFSIFKKVCCFLNTL